MILVKRITGFALIMILQALLILVPFLFDTPLHGIDTILSILIWLLPLVAYIWLGYRTRILAAWPWGGRLAIFSTFSIITTIAGFYFFVFLWFTMSFGGWPWEHYLPNESKVRQQFENHRADYIQLVSLLRKNPSVTYVDGDGNVEGVHERHVVEYHDLLHKIGAKDVLVRDDDSIEFELYGYGCTICSDSFMGIRYVPKDYHPNIRLGWTQTVVTSLDSAKLPQENGAVASGLYVIPIEPGWFVYRLEIQE